jgi:PAS domain S-box-containing protein
LADIYLVVLYQAGAEPGDQAEWLPERVDGSIAWPISEQEFLEGTERFLDAGRAQGALQESTEGIDAAPVVGQKRSRVRDKMLETLQGLQLYYQTVADFTVDWVYWEGPDGALRYVSPSCERVTGYPAERFIANPDLMVELLLPEDRDLWARHRHDALSLGPQQILFRIRRQGGEIRWIEHACQPVVDEQGVFLGYRASNRDVTERKRAEEELLQYREHLEELVTERTAELTSTNAALRMEIAERQRVEKALRETTRLLETIFAHIHVLVAVMDPQFNFIRVNQAYAEADERDPDFFPGKNHFDLYPHSENEAIFRRVVETGEPYFVYAKPFEYAEHPERGASYWDWSLVPIKDSGGMVTGLVLTLADVTGRVETQEALRESEEKYRLLVDHAHDAIVVAQDDMLRFVNPKAAEIAGYSQQELLSIPFEELIHPDDRDQVLACYQRFLEGAETVDTLTLRILAKGGGVKWLGTNAVFVEWGGRPASLNFMTDVTERRLAEEALRESEARFRRTFDQAPIGAAIVSLDDRFLRVNEVLCRITGYSEDELTAMHWSDITHADDLLADRAQVQRLRTGEIDQYDRDKRYLRKDGSPFWVHVSARVIRDIAGHPLYFLPMIQEITERRRSEDALRKAKEAAEVAGRREQERRQEAERRRHIAESLVDILGALNSDQPLGDVLNYIATQAGRLLGTRAIGIYKLEGEAGRLTVQAAKGLLLTYVAGSKIPIGQGALRQAMVLRKPVSVLDVAAALSDDGDLVLDARSRARAGSWIDVYRSLLAVPIVVQDQVYGGIVLYYSKAGAFSDEDVDLALAFADQIALAIENAWLRDQVRHAAVRAERDRLARDLHDAVTQTLFSASLVAETLPRVWERRPEVGRQALQDLHRLTRGALAEMRTLLLELRPAALIEKPLGELLVPLTEAAASRTQVPIKLAVEGDRKLPGEVQIVLYRIAQEALNNVAKHADASQVTVDLCCGPGWALLRVCDDGKGFDPADVETGRMGLSIMRERAEGVGASLEIDSRPECGTQLLVDWREGGGI